MKDASVSQQVPPSGVQPSDAAADSGLESVRRALHLLKVLQSGETLSVKQAAERLGVSSASAHRLFITLKTEGFVTQLGDRRYRAGEQLSPLRPRNITKQDLESAVWPIIEELQQKTGETVHVWYRRGSQLFLAHSILGSKEGAVPHDALKRIPAYATASGRALLAELPNGLVQDIHRQGFLPWRDAKIHSLDALKRRLATIRKEGFEVTHEEAMQGTSGLGICVYDPWNRPALGIGLALPNERFETTDLAEYVHALEEARAKAKESLARLYIEQQFFNDDEFTVATTLPL